GSTMLQQEQQVILALDRLADIALSRATTSRERELIIADRDMVAHAVLHGYETSELVQIDLDDVRDVLTQHRTDSKD
ncbi:MAG TPA: hypothetical protein VK640_02820, partial [Actinomycetes bacterium]|nr:hypothetical protein [Actinomycetes bacterium]